MGRECGFEFYKLVNDKLANANVVHEWLDEKKDMCNCLYICGRCEATDIFLNAVWSKEKSKRHGYDSNEELKPEDKFVVCLLLNHPELDGFSIPWKIEEYNESYKGWFYKYCYYNLNEFKNLFDFERAQKEHDDTIKNYEDSITYCQNEVELLRKHQENAKTKVAFDGFEEKIEELKDKIEYYKEQIIDIKEYDYDYDHYMMIKKYLEAVETKIKEDEDLIVTAFASD